MTEEVKYYRHGLNDRGRKIFEGLVISNNGWQPTQQELSREYGRLCVECNEEEYHGIFSVGYGRKWFGLRKKIEFVNFTCKDCWEEIHPHYEYEKMNYESLIHQ